MFDSAQADHAVCHLPDLFAAALYDDHFQAGEFVEMDVGRGENHVVGKVLSFCQLLCKLRKMMVVYQRQRADNRLVRIYGF